MIFKRFSLQKKNPEFSDICEQEILKINFFNNNKNFQNASLGTWNIYTVLGHFILYYKKFDSRQLQLLHPTELLYFCCSVVQFIPLDCGYIAVV